MEITLSLFGKANDDRLEGKKALFEKLKDKLLNKNLSLMMCGNLASTLLSVVMVKILTNKLTVSEYGHYSLIMSFVSLPLIVVFSPLSAAIYPFIQKRKNESRYKVFQDDIFELYYLINYGIALILILILVSQIVFGKNNFEMYENLVLTFVFSSTMGLLTILDTFSLANSRIKEFVMFPAVNLVTKIITVLIMFKVDVGAVELILIFSLIQMFLFVVEYIYLRKKNIVGKIVTPISKEILNISGEKKEIINYSFNFVVWGAFSWAQSFFDKWLLNTYATKNDIAIYAVYYQYGFFPFTVISSIISQYITPIYFTKTEHVKEQVLFISKLMKKISIIILPCLIIVPAIAYTIAPQVITLLTNNNYLEHVALFPLVVVAGIFFCFGQIIAVPLLSAERVSSVRLPKIITSILAMGLFVALVPSLRIKGIFWALIIANFSYLVLLYISNYNYVKDLDKAKQ